MRLPSLSTMAEDYVKLVWKAGERGGQGLATRDIAASLGVSASTVSGNLRKLDRDGLIEHTPYYGVVLTPLGQQVAVAMVRRHRLIETFLVQRLGYSWDEVHTEAEALEHAVSETFLERVDADLGHPTHDPHGDPIPAADGTVPRPRARCSGPWSPVRAGSSTGVRRRPVPAAVLSTSSGSGSGRTCASSGSGTTRVIAVTLGPPTARSPRRPAGPPPRAPSG